MNCPYCGKEAKTEHGLRRHLMGRIENSGHELPQSKAELLARQVAQGLTPKPPRSNPLTQIFNRSKPETNVPNQKPTASYPVSDNPYEAFLHELFMTMVKNKQLPKYQFERRVDAILNLFIPDLLKALYGWQVEVVVPEFPLKIHGSNQSTNADYLLFRYEGAKATQAWLLFELKTDNLSIRDKQITDYLTAAYRGMPQLYKELKQIAKASKHRTKYLEIIQRIGKRPLDIPVELVYLSPGIHSTMNPSVHAITFAQLQELELPHYSEAWNMFRSVILPALV